MASFALRKVGTYQVEASLLAEHEPFRREHLAARHHHRHSPDGGFVPGDPRGPSRSPAQAAGLHGHGPQFAGNSPSPITRARSYSRSPTDSWTIFPKHEYATLGLTEPPAESTLLATFNPTAYTFTTADQGSHTFIGAVTFGKGGAESLKVTQANNSKVSGKTIFSIG